MTHGRHARPPAHKYARGSHKMFKYLGKAIGCHGCVVHVNMCLHVYESRQTAEATTKQSNKSQFKEPREQERSYTFIQR